jgi:hypothetical protein
MEKVEDIEFQKHSLAWYQYRSVCCSFLLLSCHHGGGIAISWGEDVI